MMKSHATVHRAIRPRSPISVTAARYRPWPWPCTPPRQRLMWRGRVTEAGRDAHAERGSAKRVALGFYWVVSEASMTLALYYLLP